MRKAANHEKAGKTLVESRHTRLENLGVRATQTMKSPHFVHVTDVELLSTSFSFFGRQIVCFLQPFDAFDNGSAASLVENFVSVVYGDSVPS